MKTKCEYSGTLLIIISRKYFSVFRGPHLPLDTPFWTRCFPLVMQSRKAGFLFCSTSSDAGALPSEVRIENDSDRKFSGNHLYPRFMVRCSLLAENIFSVFRSPHLPLDTLIKKSSCSWTFYY